MAIKDISKEGVSSAIGQFDFVGRDGMLEKYGGGKSIKWYIEKNNQYYDQKLIIRAAMTLSYWSQHQDLPLSKQEIA